MENEIERLRQEFYALPKTDPHGMEQQIRHPDIRPEWIMSVIHAPYEVWEESARQSLPGVCRNSTNGLRSCSLGSLEFGLFNTAYADRRLEKDYGGRPWPEK